MEIVVDVPESCLVDVSPEELGRRLKLSAALLMYQTGRLSAGGACELAGVDRYSFLAACREHGIPVIRTGEVELEEELASLDAVVGR